MSDDASCNCIMNIEFVVETSRQKFMLKQTNSFLLMIHHSLFTITKPEFFNTFPVLPAIAREYRERVVLAIVICNEGRRNLLLIDF